MRDYSRAQDHPLRLVVFCDEDLGVAGGGSRQVLEFVRALSLHRYEICVIAPQPNRDRVEEEPARQVHFRWVWVPRLRGLRPFAYLVASALVLGWAMLRWRPDFLLWFDSPGQVAPLVCASVAGCPYLLFVNGLPDEELRSIWRWVPLRWLIRLGLKAAVQRAAAVVSVCPEILRWMQEHWEIQESRCRVIRNGVDPERFRPLDAAATRRELGLEESGSYVGFVGGFFPWHGLETLIEAVPLVLHKVPGTRFLLIGDGCQRSALEARVREMGLAHAIRFVGRVEFEEVPRWIAACDLCVVLHKATRSYPGDSMKLWEYLACGRPVVATAGPGYGETVETIGCGLSVKPNDPQDVAWSLAYLLADAGARVRMGQRGRDAVLHEHTWDVRASILDALFRGLPHGRSCRPSEV